MAREQLTIFFYTRASFLGTKTEYEQTHWASYDVGRRANDKFSRNLSSLQWKEGPCFTRRSYFKATTQTGRPQVQDACTCMYV